MSFPVVRTPLAILAAVLILSSAAPRAARAASGAVPRFKAVAFDYFVLFNPDSIVPAVERAFPGKGRELTNLWRTRQFEYSWLRSMTDRYADFMTVTEDALVYSTKVMKLKLTDDSKRQLLDAYMRLEPWSDTRATLDQLKASGVRVVTVSNFSPAMLRQNADHAGLTGLFDILISTDANQSYKPDPRAYALAIDRLHLAKQDILFAAFGGWDAAGARSFGYPTIWINRFDQPAEELGIHPNRTSRDLSGLLQFVLKM
jgi:2-haloacid dehalogenase